MQAPRTCLAVTSQTMKISQISCPFYNKKRPRRINGRNAKRRRQLNKERMRSSTGRHWISMREARRETDHWWELAQTGRIYSILTPMARLNNRMVVVWEKTQPRTRNIKTYSRTYWPMRIRGTKRDPHIIQRWKRLNSGQEPAGPTKEAKPRSTISRPRWTHIPKRKLNYHPLYLNYQTTAIMLPWRKTKWISITWMPKKDRTITCILIYWDPSRDWEESGRQSGRSTPTSTWHPTIGPRLTWSNN